MRGKEGSEASRQKKNQWTRHASQLDRTQGGCYSFSRTNWLFQPLAFNTLSVGHAYVCAEVQYCVSSVMLKKNTRALIWENMAGKWQQHGHRAKNERSGLSLAEADKRSSPLSFTLNWFGFLSPSTCAYTLPFTLWLFVVLCCLPACRFSDPLWAKIFLVCICF
jgi:hypothetical protein